MIYKTIWIANVLLAVANLLLFFSWGSPVTLYVAGIEALVAGITYDDTWRKQ